jgi:hypothetical protein
MDDLKRLLAEEILNPLAKTHGLNVIAPDFFPCALVGLAGVPTGINARLGTYLSRRQNLPPSESVTSSKTSLRDT